jgi:radical SAM protein with 4Fe4S-binding SPASM domain
MPILAITTVVGCKVMCTFCPQTLFKKSYHDDEKILSLDNFNKILEKTPKHVDIHFSGNAEPWLNKDATKMLELALIKGHSVAIFTTLVGMSPEDAIKVTELCTNYKKQIKLFEIHLPDKYGNMKGWRISDTFVTVLKLFVEFGNKNIIKEFNMMTMGPNGIDDVSENLVELVKDSNVFSGWTPVSRAGTLDNVVAPSHDYPIYCSKTPYYDRNILLPNGDVSICCEDYGLKHILGNILTQEYEELFTGDEINKVRKINMLDEYSDQTTCRNCEFARPVKTFIKLNHGEFFGE